MDAPTQTPREIISTHDPHESPEVLLWREMLDGRLIVRKDGTAWRFRAGRWRKAWSRSGNGMDYIESRTRLDGKRVAIPLARLIWSVKHRQPVPAGYEVDHIVPRALGGTNAPENLRLLTRAANYREAVTAGLFRGERNGQAKLSEQDVVAIRERAASGEHPAELAKEHGVSVTAIRRVVARESWGHVA